MEKCCATTSLGRNGVAGLRWVRHFFEYRTLFGRDAGSDVGHVYGHETIEIKSKRDGLVIIPWLFLATTHYFYSQSPNGHLVTGCDVGFNVATLIRSMEVQ